MQDDRSWAAHPNADLRLAISTYLGRGYFVESLSDDAAVLAKRSRFSIGRFMFLGLLYPLTRLGRTNIRRRLWVGPAGEIDDDLIVE
jgi:hypothetical protein